MLVTCCLLLTAWHGGGKGKDGGGGATDSTAATALGRQVFNASCAACHKNPVNSKAPTAAAFKTMEPRMVLNALNNGKMRPQATSLTAKQREAVAQFVTGKWLKVVNLPKDAYTIFTYKPSADKQQDYAGWGGNLAGTGFRTTEQAGITKENVATLELKWAFAFPDESDVRSKPAIIGDWLIVGSQLGDVYAINRFTGKIGWHVMATSGIRSGITFANTAKGPVAYFADGATYTYAVNVATGKILWSTRAGMDPLSMNTGTVAVYGGKVFVPISSIEVAVAADSTYACCTSSGGVAALDAATGAPVWYHRVVPKATAQANKKNGKPFYGPSGAPVWCSPTIDTKRGLLYIGSGENYTKPTTATSDAIQALDIKTGKLVWNFQATENDAWNLACPVIVNCPGNKGRDLDFGMAPVLTTGEDGEERLLVGQKAGVVYALSPNDGKLLWRTRVGKGGALGGIHWGMATDGKKVYAANADNVLALNPDSASIKASPGVYAINIVTGAVTWSAAAPKVQGTQFYLAANSAAPAVVPGVVFAGSNDGHIRAYSTDDGSILWDYNTAQTYTAVNGIKANGGSIDGPAPVMRGGMLYVNSGYAQFGEKAGNVLLAFEVKK